MATPIVITTPIIHVPLGHVENEFTIETATVAEDHDGL